MAYTLDTTLPMMATPRAPPTWRVVSLMAEPTPAFSRGSEPITDSVAGAIVMPMPAAMMHEERDHHRVRRVGGDRRQQEQAGVTSVSPAGRPLGADPLDEPGRQRGDDIIVAAYGSSRTPASSGV